MLKTFRLSLLQNLLPEVLAALAIICTMSTESLFAKCLLLLCYSVTIRSVWNSAIIIHGLGHTIAIATVDRQLSAIDFTNILEHRSIEATLKSLLPFNRIFIPAIDSQAILWIAAGDSNFWGIRVKALGGIVFNLLAVIIVYLYSNSSIAHAFVTANLIIAITSLSDMAALVTGVADCFNCGNFGLIAQRREDEPELLPARMVDIALQMGRETEIRGEQAGGGLVLARNGEQTVFVGKKIVNRKRENLTQSLEAAFAPLRKKAIASGVKPLESIMGAWHYRYATSGTAPSVLETHWHEWMGARNENIWQFADGKWNCQPKNVNHRITHNGDFDSWKIFGKDEDSATLGLWLERVLHTPNATKGDSPKIAGMMDLLITKGMWYPSVRLAYQQAIATSIELAFDGRKPSADAPNTAPSIAELNHWADLFNRTFDLHKQVLPPQSNESYQQYLAQLEQNLLQVIARDNSLTLWAESKRVAFVRAAVKAFFNNDLYRATKIFMSRAKGSFGLVTVSTLEPERLVLSAKGQPLAIGFNWQQGYTIYASEPAAVDRILVGKPQTFRLDLDRQGGEIALVSAKDIAVYSMSKQRLLLPTELNNRWILLQEHTYLPYIQFAEPDDRDPVDRDIRAIPKILNDIKLTWQNPDSLNRKSADYLLYLLTEKVQRFEKKQRIMFQAGAVSKVRQMSAVDLLITGEENSLWIGEKFARDLNIVFPLLNVVTRSANEVLQQLKQDSSQLYLSKDSLILAITQSGQTFSTVQAIDAFDRLCSQGTIGELFILTGELSSFISSIQGKGGLTTITSSSFVDTNNKKLQRIFVNGSGRRTAEPSTVAVAAATQTLIELLLYLAKQMRKNFPRSEPFGMSLTQESLQVLAMIKEDFLNKNVMLIAGTTDRGEPLESAIRQQLIKNGGYWGNHITETPLAWAIHSLYILITVGWAIPFGETIPLVKTVSQLILAIFSLPQSLWQLIAPAVTLADIAVYIFGAWLWTLLIRCFQSRQLLARMGKRTLVIGDVSWVNQLLQAYVSKLFSLSYGIASLEVHGDNPQNHFLHAFGHRVVRGTLIWLGVPDGRRSQRQEAAETATIMTGKQASGVRNVSVGAEIVAIGHNPAIAHKGFSKALILGSNDDSIYFRNLAVAKQKEQIEELRESCFSAVERLLASYVFFWALAKKVASFPLLKYEYWKSQSRTKIMTTASPVSGLDSSHTNNQQHQNTKFKNYSRKN